MVTRTVKSDKCRARQCREAVEKLKVKRVRLKGEGQKNVPSPSRGQVTGDREQVTGRAKAKQKSKIPGLALPPFCFCLLPLDFDILVSDF
jgi:hypothetical protein